MKWEDISWPREYAERSLCVKAGEHSLDELAASLSRTRKEEPISVRDIHTTPVRHSRVHLNGEPQDGSPYLARMATA